MAGETDDNLYRGPANTPDDWAAHWWRCTRCGQPWHASEPGCECGGDDGRNIVPICSNPRCNKPAASPPTGRGRHSHYCSRDCKLEADRIRARILYLRRTGNEDGEEAADLRLALTASTGYWKLADELARTT